MNVLDIETFQKNNKVVPYCISYVINNKIYSIYYKQDCDLIIQAIEHIVSISKNNQINLFVHNINFDGMIILSYLIKYEIKFEWIVRELDIYSIKFKYMSCEINLRCSYKLIPITLSELNDGTRKKMIFPHKFVNENTLNYIGSCPDIEYFESLHDYLTFKEKNTTFNLKKQIIEYCENDVLLTQRLLINIYDLIKNIDNRLFWKSYSAPALAYKIYFKKYNEKNIKNQIKKEDADYIRRSYYGGRCEVFGNPYPEEFVNYFDFSGMYAQCMLEQFPIGSPLFKNNTDYNEVGFHTIKYESNLKLPILPYHFNNKLLFPNGCLTGTFWYEEIQEFVKYGGKVLETYSSLTYSTKDYVFQSYVKTFDKLKKEGDYHKIFAKLMINGLYGGFAMDDEDFFSLPVFNEIEFQTILNNTNVIKWSKQNNCIIINIKKDHKSAIYFNKQNKKWSETVTTRNVSYASIIAAKARIKLYRGFESVRTSGGRLLYSDTDSIFAAYPRDMTGCRHGEIKWAECYKDAFFIAPKFYGYITNKETVKIKGIRQKNLNFKEIKEAFYNNQEFLKFTDELQFIKKNYELNQRYVEKKIWLNVYNKRIFSKDKKTTQPLFL